MENHLRVVHKLSGPLYRNALQNGESGQRECPGSH